MLIEVEGNRSAVTEVRKELARVAGENVSDSELSQKGVLEVKDVDS